MRDNSNITESQHFLLRSAPPFIWLRAKEDGEAYSFGVPENESSVRTIDWKRWHIVFREEFQVSRYDAHLDGGMREKRLWRGEWSEDNDCTSEVKELLPAEMMMQYMLETGRLVRRFGHDVKSKGAFLMASPEELTAIMGPSGAGKSVFLKMLCGYDRPSAVLHPAGHEIPMTDDAIRICGATGENAFDYLGYVPQGDLLYPELTTEQSLRYRMKLKFGSLLTEEDISQCIEHACIELMNLDKSKLKQQIGNIDWIGSYPSGGERRRINIAHELVLEPRVLILDEPTSGLSSQDSRDVMKALVRLAHSKQMCIIMTIHQPSMEMFRKIDDLLLLVGGSVAYYGRRALALEWLKANGLPQPEPKENKALETKAEDNTAEENEADAILAMVKATEEQDRGHYNRIFEEYLDDNGGVPSKITTLD
ncbi:MAG: ATP-binding cassette domain-containing protein [Victivallales bacterium]|nr:ATP-binding cassette domain-containing protein [Victivallales bacterium]